MTYRETYKIIHNTTHMVRYVAFLVSVRFIRKDLEDGDLRCHEQLCLEEISL